MNRYLTYLSLILILSSCTEDKLSVLDWFDADAVEIKSVEASIVGGSSTRAAALDAYNYVGRSMFVNGDSMVLTTIKRTISPINGFTYSGIVYNQVVEQDQTSGGWNRDASAGHALDKDGNPLSTHPERIYWSDAHNGHTYIGYSAPQQPTGAKAFDWTVKNATYEGSGTKGIPVYYGSIGDPTVSGIIDYTNDEDDTPVKDTDASNSASSYKSGNEKIKQDDILLTWDNAKVAETGGSVAKLYFHHGLAQVRVIVNIQGFSASTDAVDSRSVVSNMILKDMITMYKWRQQSYEADTLNPTYDAANIRSIYGSNVCDQKKDVHMWIPRPNGTGTGVGKQFTFYGLAVPRTMGVDNVADANKDQNLNFEFTVTYPDPMNPKENVNKIYRAYMPNQVRFRAGYCTTINIFLNHSNEKMTVGAEYMDWQLVETPDQGELKKNLTLLQNTDRNTVTIIGDPKANEDDATWLYVDTKDGNKLKDIYGNDGSAANPFKIATAKQLLSFAYEVKGTDRISTTCKNLDGNNLTLSGGFDFSGYYVKLDADITLQKSLEIWHDNSGFYKFGTDNVHDYSINSQGVTWIGIGDSTHPFNGVFNGGYRHISKLYGAAFFNTIGSDGIVDHIFMSDALGITGRGSIAEVNNGVICGAYIEGDVEAINTGTVKGSYCGSIVGENHSMLISCSHIGDIKGTNYETVGALLGYNDGIVAICYNCGNVTSSESGENTYAGIGKYTARSIAYCSYFNGDLFHGHDYRDLNKLIGHVAYPLTTAIMQSNVFVNKYAPYEGLTKEHEIIDDGLPLQTDPFFYHLSLNYGIRRAVAMLQRAVLLDADPQGYIPIHGASGSSEDPNRYEVLKLKKTLVEWLIKHYSYMDGTELKFSHQFQFIPGAYPKLK